MYRSAPFCSKWTNLRLPCLWKTSQEFKVHYTVLNLPTMPANDMQGTRFVARRRLGCCDQEKNGGDDRLNRPVSDGLGSVGDGRNAGDVRDEFNNGTESYVGDGSVVRCVWRWPLQISVIDLILQIPCLEQKLMKRNRIGAGRIKNESVVLWTALRGGEGRDA
jgi:hypothetical protein